MNEKQCRAIVLARCDNCCERCGRGGQVTMHHRKKRGQGGPWEPWNIVGLCGHGTTGCHGWVESNPLAAAATGWHVRPWEDPRTIIPIPLWKSGVHGGSDSAGRGSDQLERFLYSPLEPPYSDYIDTSDDWFP
ncbi:HNH endonuclease [Mycobacterium phage MrMagoo]|uniref:HNH endonuclease n=1 Tax=Mycobacterium phage MrMagoo TaxID=1927020 RepID=A0A1L6BYU3_9CAUD|nr:HNH endonuclease [Mycobacterium phage MrMagoo]APQ42259.1 HNH endonuclease [Mycobacterium phage MrMagoo]